MLYLFVARATVALPCLVPCLALPTVARGRRQLHVSSLQVVSLSALRTLYSRVKCPAPALVLSFVRLRAMMGSRMLSLVLMVASHTWGGASDSSPPLHGGGIRSGERPHPWIFYQRWALLSGQPEEHRLARNFTEAHKRKRCKRFIQMGRSANISAITDMHLDRRSDRAMTFAIQDGRLYKARSSTSGPPGVSEAAYHNMFASALRWFPSLPNVQFAAHLNSQDILRGNESRAGICGTTPNAVLLPTWHDLNCRWTIHGYITFLGDTDRLFKLSAGPPPWEDREALAAFRGSCNGVSARVVNTSLVNRLRIANMGLSHPELLDVVVGGDNCWPPRSSRIWNRMGSHPDPHTNPPLLRIHHGNLSYPMAMYERFQRLKNSTPADKQREQFEENDYARYKYVLGERCQCVERVPTRAPQV